MRNYKGLFIYGFEFKALIYTMAEFLNLCPGGTDASIYFWWLC